MDLKNLTRTESLLANIAGYTGVPVPDMKNATRSERLLKEILDNGGGGGGGDVTKEYVDNAISNAVADIDDDISALSDTVADKVDKVNGKSLSTNDYTDADKALVQNSPITTTSTASPIPTANGKPRKLTIYGKSEIVDGAIKSAGEGYAIVRLADLSWSYIDALFVTNDITDIDISVDFNAMITPNYVTVSSDVGFAAMPDKSIKRSLQTTRINIKDTNYTTVSDFITSLGDATLCYQLADPSQGNAIAVKTDNGTGIDGTMATFTTGTPLYGIGDTVRNIMAWDGLSGEVTKNCNKVRLADLTWNKFENRFYTSNLRNIIAPFVSVNTIPNILSNQYITTSLNNIISINKSITVDRANDVNIRDTDYTTVSDFVASLGDAELVYELATPTTTPLTATENESLSSLKTYAPSTVIAINDNPEFEVEAYANTANGQTISDMQPTRSPLLTLTASGWTNNAQTVTYEHDTGKRNTIDVEPASIKAWTAAGILATAETASTITFECDTVPTADLSFRVTSMEVR